MIIPLLTVLASGITAAFVTHILNSRKEERLLVRQKLEDLHLAVHRYIIAISLNFMPFLQAMEGVIDYNQANNRLKRDRQRRITNHRTSNWHLLSGPRTRNDEDS